MKKKKIIRGVLVIALLAVLGYSGFRMWDIYRGYAKEAERHGQLMEYKPTLPPNETAPVPGPDGSAAGSEPAGQGTAPEPKVNQEIVDLQAKYPDVIGWITVANTKIDYPFVQSRDNGDYLHRDLDKKSLSAGTIFLDCRNHIDFSDFNSVIYGHHMKNGSMFGTLQSFNDRQFFEDNRTGAIFLADKTYTVEFFAFIVLKPDDSVIYDPVISGDADKQAFLSHIKSAARYYRDLDLTEDDHIVTLSTCNYEFNNARMVLLGRLKEI